MRTVDSVLIIQYKRRPSIIRHFICMSTLNVHIHICTKNRTCINLTCPAWRLFHLVDCQRSCAWKEFSINVSNHQQNPFIYQMQVTKDKACLPHITNE